ncbi:MAG: winged helix DNA-binding protein [Erythrobacter sp.]|nr:winged helix DNA-binding protein [Erythrobacter sp.]
MIDTTSARDADLQPFADQLIAIAEQLRAGDLSSASKLKDATNENMIVPGDLDGDPVAIDPGEQRERFAEMARVAYAKRRKRTVIFGDPELFGEPAWDILLDLYIAQVEGKAVSVSSACIGSASPPTTGLRWLGVLAEQGLLHREHDPQDQRRVLVRLTDKALDAMDDYFASSAGFQTDRRAARA